MLAKISKTDAEWLLRVFAPVRGGRVDNSTFKTFLRAHNIMKGVDRQVGCFSCEGRTIAKIASSMYDQYETEIKAITSPAKKTRKKDV